jgi:hypothetical protein
VDALLIAGLSAAVLLVHDVSYLLHQPFWMDEAWVADSLRAPMHLTPRLSSSTPLGWSLLLRLVPAGGGQGYRLVPLAFTMMATATAYLLGRELRIGGRAGAVLVGVSVLLCPGLLVRDDLKQYTAEAWAALTVLLLVARLENQWSGRRLAQLMVFAVAGLLVADTVVFVGLAAIAALLLDSLRRRDRRRAFQVGGGAVGVLAAWAGFYAIVIRPNVTAKLESFWDVAYVPRHGGVHALMAFMSTATHNVVPYIGFRWWPVDAVLVLGGLAVLARRGRFLVAAVLPFTLALQLAASGARRYPFGDLRTSTFWVAMASVAAAGGVAAAVEAVARRRRRLSVATLAVSIGLWTLAADPHIRSHPIPDEDARAQTAFVDQHFRPGDVVIVSETASFGFAYYDRRLHPTFARFAGIENGFLPSWPDQPWIVRMTGHRPADVSRALGQAAARLAAEGPRHTGRIWIVRSHLFPDEAPEWRAALAGERVITYAVGREPLLLYEPPATSGSSGPAHVA